MKTLITGILAVIALCACAIGQNATSAPTTSPDSHSQHSAAAQSAPANPAQRSTNNRIAPGSIIPVQLTKSIDVKKIKTGDEVEAKVTQDMKTGSGEVLVPKDTKVFGRVTEAQPRNKEQKESQVGIAFDRAVMKTGGDVSLPMSIQAIIAPFYLSANSSSSGEANSQQQSTGSAVAQGNPNLRGGSMGGAQPPNPTPPPSTEPSEDKTGSGARQPVTGNTQGVLGIPNLKLSTTTDAAQGSVMTSEKNNVKLESGTLMLLRVNGTASQQQSSQQQ